MEIYVGGLEWGVEDGELKELFAAHGTVDRISLVRDRATGRARGFGFVEMPDRGEAEKAIVALHGVALRGRTLRVAESLKSRGPQVAGRDNYKTGA